jgi:hypothetical protein
MKMQLLAQDVAERRSGLETLQVDEDLAFTEVAAQTLEERACILRGALATVADEDRGHLPGGADRLTKRGSAWLHCAAPP